MTLLPAMPRAGMTRGISAFGHYPVLKYGGFDVDKQRPVQATVGADAQAYSGQTVTLEGSGRAFARRHAGRLALPLDGEPTPTALTPQSALTFFPGRKRRG